MVFCPHRRVERGKSYNQQQNSSSVGEQPSVSQVASGLQRGRMRALSTDMALMCDNAERAGGGIADPYDATALVAAIERRDATAHEAVCSALERIQCRDSDVRAWAHVDRERSVGTALASDRRGDSALRSLEGVPIGVKDLIDTADFPTAYGSERYRGNRPLADAACVTALTASGAIVIGKTVTTELALWSPPPTRNPHALSRTPGGSSAGSAAAVADFMVPIAIGTQTAGSIIRPASYCGVLGFVPTAGRWDVAGLKPISPSLDRVGIFARTSNDLRLAGGALGGAALESNSNRLEHVLIGIATDVEAAAPGLPAVLSAIGSVHRVDLWQLLDDAAFLHDALMRRELRETLRAEVENPDGLAPATQEFLASLRDAGEGYSVDALWAEISACRAEVDKIFTTCDVIVSSCVAGEPPLAREGTGDPWFCRLWSLLGLPAVSVPACVSASGLPVGVQIVGRGGHDELVLDVAELLVDRIRAVGSVAWERAGEGEAGHASSARED